MVPFAFKEEDVRRRIVTAQLAMEFHCAELVWGNIEIGRKFATQSIQLRRLRRA
jgi:hypothetical protein